MHQRQYGHSTGIKFFYTSWKTKNEDRLEIIGIFLSLLVIGAFVIIAFTVAIPMMKASGDMITSTVDFACLGKTLETRP